VSVPATALPPRLRRVVSSRVGIVTTLDECLVDVDEPPLIRVSCDLAAAEEVLGGGLATARSGAGTGMTLAHAAAAAVGEAIERYSATFVPHERLRVATAAELGLRAADPTGFGLFSESQYARPRFPYARFTSETRLAWVGATDLATGEPAWVPADLVFLQAVAHAEAEHIGYATSNGLACGSTAIEALERALLELLERDAFMLAWWRRLSPPRLEPRNNSWTEAVDRRYFRETGLDYVALDLSSVHDVPTVVGIVRGPPGSGAALGVGGAAAPRVEDAWWRALAEAFAARSACRKLRLLAPGRVYADDGSDVSCFDDHICFYGDEERAELAAFLWSSSEARAPADVPALRGEPEERVAALVERVERAGSRAFAVDVTAPDVAAAGLHVVRAVAPGLCPLDAAHDARFLGSPRLTGLAERDILTTPGRRLDDLNPLPHPFP
jgi:ribosomal protein S12 methylthiotransferase accessory factor